MVGAVIFTGISSRRSLNRDPSKSLFNIVFGLIYGFLLWAALIGIILPNWIDVVAPWRGGPLQNFTNLQLLGALVGFLLYGSIVGGSVRIQHSHRVEENADFNDSEENDSTTAEFVWEDEERERG